VPVKLKLMALNIYAKVSLAMPRPKTLSEGQGLAVTRPRQIAKLQILALRPRINITVKTRRAHSVEMLTHALWSKCGK